MELSATARRQVNELRRYYREKGRPEALRNLTQALRLAARQITAGDSRPAPRPYPAMAVNGEGWTKAGSYWIAHTTTKPHVILAVFYDQADIPKRHS